MEDTDRGRMGCEQSVSDPTARSSTDEADDMENDDVTAAPSKVSKDPGTPSPEEVEAHDPTHLPYRSWCPVCVEACGKEDVRYSKRRKK